MGKRRAKFACHTVLAGLSTSVIVDKRIGKLGRS